MHLLREDLELQRVWESKKNRSRSERAARIFSIVDDGMAPSLAA